MFEDIWLSPSFVAGVIYSFFASLSFGLSLSLLALFVLPCWKIIREKPKSLSIFALCCVPAISGILGLLGALSALLAFERKSGKFLLLFAVTAFLWVPTLVFKNVYFATVNDANLAQYESVALLKISEQDPGLYSYFLHEHERVNNQIVTFLLNENYRDALFLADSIDPESGLDSPSKAIFFNNVGVALFGIGKFIEAKASFQKASNIYSELFEPRANLAYVEHALLNFEDYKSIRDSALETGGRLDLYKLEKGVPMPAVLPFHLMMGRLFETGYHLSGESLRNFIVYGEVPIVLLPLGSVLAISVLALAALMIGLLMGKGRSNISLVLILGVACTVGTGFSWGLSSISSIAFAFFATVFLFVAWRNRATD